MTAIVLVQPPARGRISGGFLYNRRMADSGLWELCDVPVDELHGVHHYLPDAGLVLMDSIWLTPELAPAFLSLRARGLAIGAMIHSFPSMIDATENGRTPPTEPTAFERKLIAALDVIVLPGRHYLGALGGAPPPVVVAEPGIDDAWRAPPRRRNGACQLVSVGAVTPRKGFLDVVEMLERRPQRDFTWTIAGSLDVDPAYAAQVLERTQRLPVTLPGQLSPDAVRHFVQHGDILLMPSYDENQPLVLLEAMAAGVPAIAYAAGATRQMLGDGREGLVASIGDRGAFAEHLERLLDDEALRYRLALGCHQRQSSLPNWPTAAQRAMADLTRAIAR